MALKRPRADDQTDHAVFKTLDEVVVHRLAKTNPSLLLDALRKNNQLPHLLVMHNTHYDRAAGRSEVQNHLVRYAFCAPSDVPEWVQESHNHVDYDVGINLTDAPPDSKDSERLVQMEKVFEQDSIPHTQFHHFEVCTTSYKNRTLERLAPKLYAISPNAETKVPE